MGTGRVYFDLAPCFFVNVTYSHLLEFHHLALQLVAVQMFFNENVRVCYARARPNQGPRLPYIFSNQEDKQ